MKTNLSRIGGVALAATLGLWCAAASAQQVITETVTPASPIVKETVTVPAPAPVISEQRTTTTTTTTAPAPRRVLTEDEKEYREKVREAKKEYREEVKEAAKDALDD